jgi:UDP-2,3-diacylglucosamine hydrolase
MSPRKIEIKEGAFIISDAHYSDLRPELIDFLIDIRAGRLRTSQIILMGDIFDALFGEIPYTHQVNRTVINILNDLSYRMEIIYLEGNHDFNLKSIFPRIKLFPIEKQPLECSYKDKKIYLAHGDFGNSISYKIYTKVIRSSVVLYILSFFDFVSKHAIVKKLDNYLSQKNDCRRIQNFEEVVHLHLFGRYECDYFIEGHFHQGSKVFFEDFEYINLGAFACNQRYFTVKSIEDKELLEENMFSKEI